MQLRENITFYYSMTHFQELFDVGRAMCILAYNCVALWLNNDALIIFQHPIDTTKLQTQCSYVFLFFLLQIFVHEFFSSIFSLHFLDVFIVFKIWKLFFNLGTHSFFNEN